jgi:hypothetical protein
MLLLLAGQFAQANAQVQSQNRLPSVRPAPQPSAPAVRPGGAGMGVPSPSGLPSPSRSPAGLVSQFPSGVPSPLPNPQGLPSPTVPNISAPGSAPGSPPIDAGVAPPINVMGAVGYGGVPAMSPPTPSRVGPITALEIAQSFLAADANRDGELTRAEAQRLTLMPYSFEEMDRNRDGILTRFEYEDGVR